MLLLRYHVTRVKISKNPIGHWKLYFPFLDKNALIEHLISKQFFPYFFYIFFHRIKTIEEALEHELLHNHTSVSIMDELMEEIVQAADQLEGDIEEDIMMKNKLVTIFYISASICYLFCSFICELFYSRLPLVYFQLIVIFPVSNLLQSAGWRSHLWFPSSFAKEKSPENG